MNHSTHGQGQLVRNQQTKTQSQEFHVPTYNRVEEITQDRFKFFFKTEKQAKTFWDQFATKNLDLYSQTLDLHRKIISVSSAKPLQLVA